MKQDSQIIDAYLQTIFMTCPKLDQEALLYFKQALGIRHLPAKYTVIEEGILQNSISYVATGLIRAYYTNNKGMEVNVSFIKEGDFATHYEALISNTKSKYAFQCIEPTVVIDIPLQHIRDCCDKFPLMERYLRLILEREMCVKQQRIDSFIFNTAEERYLDFITTQPDLFNRLTLTQLSSYLGIERQSLTRIRKRLLSQS